MAEGPTLRLLDLFAGCGGLTQGFVSTERFRPVGAVESDADAAATYAVNFGDHVHPGDITDWAGGSLPLAEVVVGGPPCQGFSRLGKQDSADPRNALWWQYARVLARVRPAAFLLENVPQFLDGAEFAALRAETARGGLLARWQLEAYVLDAHDYGVGQSRRRAFVVGAPRGMRTLGPPPTVPDRLTLADVLAGVPARVDGVDLPPGSVTIHGRSTRGVHATRALHVSAVPSEICAERYRAVPPGGGRLDLPEHLKLPAWRGDYRGSSDVMGRLRWDRPSVTLRTEFFKPEKGRFLHPDEDRAITHYEAALIQGFPQDFGWCGSRTSIARQIGNAVPVPMARAWGRHIAGALG